MKRLFIFLLAWLFLVSAADAATRTTVTKDSAGNVNSRVTSFVTDSGVTYIQINSDGSVSAYFNQLNLPSDSGVSQLSSGTSGYVVVYNSSTGAGPQKYISGSTVDPNTYIQAGVSTEANTITGRTFYTDLTSSENLTGQTVYGGAVGNWGSTSEVTATLPTAVKGMSVLIMLNQGQASGSTLLVLFPSSNIVGISSLFSSGASTLMLSGTTLSSYMNLEAWRDSWWFLTGVSGISYRNR